jgi:hypothetical protein
MVGLDARRGRHPEAQPQLQLTISVTSANIAGLQEKREETHA